MPHPIGWFFLVDKTTEKARQFKFNLIFSNVSH